MHIPVLYKEILEEFDPQKGQCFIDGTVNGGGHTFALWDMVKPNGKILGIDKDEDLVQALTKKVKASNANIIVVPGTYADMKQIAETNDFHEVSGILLDLGYSSYHIEQSGRGFSFQKDEPLIMRYESHINLGDDLTAYEVVNQYPENELADIIYQYGEERRSRKIAKAICIARKKDSIKTATQLAGIIASAFSPGHGGRLNIATKTFQALRIYVNKELSDLEKVLPQMLAILKPGGKMAIISFHSLEDKIVKDFIRDNVQLKTLKKTTKKPIQPSREEVLKNPRSRSAKLRVAIKL